MAQELCVVVSDEDRVRLEAIIGDPARPVQVEVDPVCETTVDGYSPRDSSLARSALRPRRTAGYILGLPQRTGRP